MKSICTFLLPALLLSATNAQQTQTAPAPASVTDGTLNEQSLGDTLKSIGLKPQKTDKRYDFAFKTSVRGEEWKFSMSAVLSRNGESVWVMAWLDEIPEKSSQVPQLALLRVLAANDRMGNGKFFAYIPANRRFVLQRVVKNKGLSSQSMTTVLQDLAVSVADEYPNWSVAKWAPQNSQPVAQDNVPNPTLGNRTQTSEKASKFGERKIQ